MTILQAILLGIIQGLTEFLPISSSAHLVLTPFIFGWKIPEQEAFIFDVLVQVGTLVAVLAFYRRDLLEIIRSFLTGILSKKPFYNAHARLGWLILFSTIPAGIIGLLLKDQVEATFSSPLSTALFLFITVFLLLSSETVGKRQRKTDQLTWKDAIWVGLFQAIAIFPGVSRSGATISGGLFRNLERQTAASFSFLMSIPVMILAGLLAINDLTQTAGMSQQLPILFVGFVTSAIVGYFSISWLLSFLVKRSLRIFAVYCLVIAIAILMLSVFKGA